MNERMLFEAFSKALATMTSRVSATNGTIVISDTSAYTGLDLSSFIASGATLTTCSGEDINRATVNFLNAPYRYGSPPDGAPIILPVGYRITAITLSAGSLAGYNS